MKGETGKRVQTVDDQKKKSALCVVMGQKH